VVLKFKQVLIFFCMIVFQMAQMQSVIQRPYTVMGRFDNSFDITVIIMCLFWFYSYLLNSYCCCRGSPTSFLQFELPALH